jgi:dipeptidyl aminopeptidase/acylaminoacyl peptidase
MRAGVLDPTIQMLVRELGVAVLVPTVRGSAGNGSWFSALARGHKREASAKDVRTALSISMAPVRP